MNFTINFPISENLLEMRTEKAAFTVDLNTVIIGLPPSPKGDGKIAVGEMTTEEGNQLYYLELIF